MENGKVRQARMGVPSRGKPVRVKGSFRYVACFGKWGTPIVCDGVELRPKRRRLSTEHRLYDGRSSSCVRRLVVDWAGNGVLYADGSKREETFSDYQWGTYTAIEMVEYDWW